MYPKKEFQKSTVEQFKIPSEWKPKEENRWVIMSKIIPWEEFEEESTSKKSLLDKLNLWINDPILRESTVAEVNRNCDRFQCLFGRC